MYSMKRTSALTVRPYSNRSTSSSSLSPRVIDRVDFQAGPASGPHRLDAGEHVGQRVDSRQPAEPIATQRVETHRNPMETCSFEVDGVIGEHHAVRREAEVAHPGLLREAAHQLGEVAPKQRLAAGQPDAIEAALREQVRRGGRSPRTSACPRAAATRIHPPACSSGTGDCSGRSPKSAGCRAAGRACRGRASFAIMALPSPAYNASGRTLAPTGSREMTMRMIRLTLALGLSLLAGVSVVAQGRGGAWRRR